MCDVCSADFSVSPQTREQTVLSQLPSGRWQRVWLMLSRGGKVQVHGFVSGFAQVLASSFKAPEKTFLIKRRTV